ncbi:hypothetical protein HDU97_006029 [Phlyctochytrium planicorne]|nr:hypothetical protein HDU97_006029 [Phlyctochytrium planicorne]
MIDRVTSFMYYPTSWFASLSFGASFAGIWTFWNRISPIGSFGSYGGFQSLRSYGELTQIVSAIGTEGLVSLFALAGPIGALWIERYAFDLMGTAPKQRVREDLDSYRYGGEEEAAFLDWEDRGEEIMEDNVRQGYEDEIYGNEPNDANGASEPLIFRERTRQTTGFSEAMGHVPPSSRPGLRNKLWTPTKAFTFFLGVSLFYGGARTSLLSGYFFQKSSDGSRVGILTVGCVSVAPAVVTDKEQLFNATSSLALHGADLVIWSEAAFAIEGTKSVQNKGDEKDNEDEDETPTPLDLFLTDAEEHAKTLNTSLGLSVLHITKTGKENLFIFINSTGSHLFTQRLSHNFPFKDTPGGSASRQSMQSGKVTDLSGINLAAAIGYDIAFAGYAARIPRIDIDLLVNPSADWGPYGTYGWRHAMLRGLEYGVTVTDLGVCT